MHQPGDLLGKYKLISLLGQGGMGAVFVAENTVIGKQVALKVLKSEFSEHESTLQRFLQEARTAASIDHPGIVEIFDFGWSEKREPYIVMELLKGRSLDSIIEQNPAGAPIDFTVDLFRQMLSVLVAVHEKGIIHRDLKPENIFLSKRGNGNEQVRILDFGISKMKSDETTVRLTQTGAVLGTPYYMSPEQANGLKDIDHRADIWAVGAIFFEVLTGQVCFPGDSYNAVLVKIFSRQMVRPRMLRPEIPEALEAVIFRAMTWERDQRYSSMNEFLADLERAKTAAPGAQQPTITQQNQAPATLVVPGQGAAEASITMQSSQDVQTSDRGGEGGAMVKTMAANVRPSDAGLFEAPGQDQTAAGYSEVAGSAGAFGMPPQPLVTQPGEIEAGFPQRGAGAIHRTAPMPILSSPGQSQPGMVPSGNLPETFSPAITESGQRRGSTGFFKIALVVGLFTVVVAGVATAMIFKILKDDDQEQMPRETVATAAPSTPGLGASGSGNQGGIAAAVNNDTLPTQGKSPTATSGQNPEPLKTAPPPIRDELTGDEIESTLLPITKKVGTCLRLAPTPPPLAQVKMQVLGDGTTTFQEVNPSQPDRVTTCLEETLSQVRFPETGRDPITVTRAFDVPTITAKSRRRPKRPRPAKKSGRFKSNPFD